MSFPEQERALFDLIFDPQLRNRFVTDGPSSLSGYELNESELNDFGNIRTDALELDASLRTNLILSQICRTYPVSFTLISSLPDGIGLLRELVDVRLMKTPVPERNARFGEGLIERITGSQFDSEEEQENVTAFIGAERGMAWTAGALKQAMVEGNKPDAGDKASNNNLSHTVKLAPFVSASILPQSYMGLKKDICKVADIGLWRHLGKSPLTARQRTNILRQKDPRLLVARAYTDSLSNFDPVIDQKTVELAEGFAILFQYIDGKMSVDDILLQLKHAGADDRMLDGIKSAFKQLLELGMLEVS